jgi:hypothetical protein
MSKMKMMQAAVLAGALAVPMAGTTSAQGPIVVGGGLVNVQIGEIEILEGGIEVRNVLNDLTLRVGLALNIAANVCGVAVGVLAADLAEDGTAVCETGDQFVVLTQ